jgi:preprotein translocase subunit SecD
MRIFSALGVILVAGLLSWFILTNEGPEAKYPIKLGLDLAGGTALVYRADTADIATDKQGALNSLREVVDKRVNLFGVAEPTRTVLQKHGGLWFNDESFVIARRPA